ncbi:transposase, MuDR, MULE transposase domain protein [Tanacetum coccineum]
MPHILKELIKEQISLQLGWMETTKLYLLLLVCHKVRLKTCKAYIEQEFDKLMYDIQAVRHDAHYKLVEDGIKKWSRAKCPANRYNYMTSNSVESVNAFTKEVRKIPITALMDWYIDRLRKWYYERREKHEDSQDEELTQWESAKIRYRMLKSSNWSVNGVVRYIIYEVRDNKMIHMVYLEKGECTCRIWQLAGLPCGHVCAITIVEALTNVNNLVKPWFLNSIIKATYEGIVYPVKDIPTWQTPNDLQVILPPVMGNKLPGRPKNRDRIRSQGEGPILTRCGRCGAIGHNKTACNVPLPSVQNTCIRIDGMQESSNPRDSFMNASHEEANHEMYQEGMYELQHISNNMEDMYHPQQENTPNYFIYEQNPESSNMAMFGNLS